MTIEWFLYMADVLGSVKTLTAIVSGIGIACTVVFTIMILVDSKDGDEPKILKVSFKFLITFVLIGLFNLFCPSEKTMYMILGTHYLKQSTLPAKIETAIEKKLDEYLHEEQK